MSLPMRFDTTTNSAEEKQLHLGPARTPRVKLVDGELQASPGHDLLALKPRSSASKSTRSRSRDLGETWDCNQLFVRT
jgi:hypothetical protein